MVSNVRLTCRRACVAAVALAVAAALAGGAAQAQISISLTPLLVELTSAPGQVETFDVLLVNESKSAKAHFRVYAADVAQRPNGDYRVVGSGEATAGGQAGAVAETGAGRYSCASWIKLSAKEATLGPGEGLSVAAQVAVPRGAYGGRYAAVVFELVPEEKTGEALASTEFVQRFVTVVELSIPAPRVKKSLAVSGFTVTPARDNPRYASAYGADALILTAALRNDGNTHVFARGMLTLRDASGRRLRQIPLGAGRGIVLPETTVSIGSVLPAGLAPGDYIADISVKYGGMRPAVAKVPFTVAAREAAAKGAVQETRLAPFSVEPAGLALSYPAGATAARTIVVENKSDQRIRVEGRAVPLAYDEEGELVQEGATSGLGSASASGAAAGDTSCAGWIELRPGSMELAPGAKQVVRVVIAIPKGQAGGKYANLVFSASPVAASSGGAAGPEAAVSVAPRGAQWVGEAGATVFLMVGKEPAKQAELTELKAEDGGPSVGWVFSATLKNTGAIHIKPSVSFAISRHVVPESVPGLEYVGPGSWEPVDSVELGELENVVLPGGTRLLRAGYARPLEPGDYRVEVSVSYGGRSPLYASKEFSVEQP